jgi:hypothetical protein
VPVSRLFPTLRPHVCTIRLPILVAALALCATLPIMGQGGVDAPPAQYSQTPVPAVAAPLRSETSLLQYPSPHDVIAIPTPPNPVVDTSSVTGTGSFSSPAATTKSTHRFSAYNPFEDATLDTRHDKLGSPYIPVDSWIYPAMLRLWALGYVNSAELSLRPWTRRSLLHMLELSQDEIAYEDNDEAVDILDKLRYALRDEPAQDAARGRGFVYGMDQAYASVRIVSGTVLRDSYHLGQTFNNDYGRPYSNGFNTYDGISGISELGPFSLHVRGEFQHAPSYQGYSFALSSQLSALDGINYGNLDPTQPLNAFGGPNRPQDTIPEGALPAQNNFRLLEANLSTHIIGNEVSFGKSDAWLGPGLGGAMSWSNNAENIYSFRINRVEPLYIPGFSRLFGTVRYDFFVGSLKGHTYPRDPWIHSEIVSISPTKNFQVSFQRSVIWGGADHVPVTIHTFLRSFFSTANVTGDIKFSPADPGARFSSVTMAYRLPFLRKRVMVYTDSITHDDVFPISAPRRAGWRPGIYFSQLPYVPKLDFRVEGTFTDYGTSRSTFGQGNYYEGIQRQGYTNKGFLIGDWIGREAKGGQAWLTYHLSGNEWISVEYLHKKNAKDFIKTVNPNVEYGTTQDSVRIDLVKRFTRDIEVSAWVQVERFKAPIWLPGQQGSTTGAFQVTWYPGLRTSVQ